MKRTLDHLERMLVPEGEVPDARNWPLVRALVGLDQPTWDKTVPGRLVPEGEDGSTVEWYSEHLNDSQKEAINFCLRAQQVACIHGPPGVSLEAGL
jgi:DNA polymerase alpha-associated DNA helicase A